MRVVFCAMSRRVGRAFGHGFAAPRTFLMIAGETPMSKALTAPQLEELKALLLARRADLTRQMVSNRANLAPAENTAGSVSQDESARLANQTREVDTALTALDAQELARIDRAQELMDAGEYGCCEECGCSIPFERLKIEPMTKHCVQCKSRWERGSPPAART